MYAATAVAPPSPGPAAPTKLQEKTAADRLAEATAETNRWILLLSFPFVLAAIFFMATIATGELWLIGGVLITGPGLMILAFIYLGISSDSNG